MKEKVVQNTRKKKVLRNNKQIGRHFHAPERKYLKGKFPVLKCLQHKTILKKVFPPPPHRRNLFMPDYLVGLNNKHV